MQIDYALILSAGLGTRMGEIGKKIPKVLWPIYLKTLLELQIRYCDDLGIGKIYINTHYLHDEIESFLKNSGLLNRVTILHEDPLLDSGGAIHNLAVRPEVNYKGNLLLINGDQFLFFDNNYWETARSRIMSCRAVLFGITVDKSAAYNETVLKENCLLEIRKNIQKNQDYVTYSGLGLLNLNGLKPCPGISKFFETVADYKKEKVEFVVPDSFEYWDFGTAEIYAQNIFKLYEEDQKHTAMVKFLIRHGALGGKVNHYINKEMSSIDLDFQGNFVEKSIHGRNIIQRY